MSDVRVIVPEALKSDVRMILKEQDLTVSLAVRLFFKEVVNQGGLPFVVDYSQPNRTTVAAMESARKQQNVTSYDSVDAMFDAWDADAQ